MGAGAFCFPLWCLYVGGSLLSKLKHLSSLCALCYRQSSNWPYLTLFSTCRFWTIFYYRSLVLTKAVGEHFTSSIYIFDGPGFFRQERLAATNLVVLP